MCMSMPTRDRIFLTLGVHLRTAVFRVTTYLPKRFPLEIVQLEAT